MEESFMSYRDQTLADESLSSDDEIVEDSLNRNASESSDGKSSIVINETRSTESEEEELIIRKTKRKNRVISISSDDSDDNNFEEREVFSPVTRKSIGIGRLDSSFTSDESDSDSHSYSDSASEGSSKDKDESNDEPPVNLASTSYIESEAKAKSDNSKLVELFDSSVDSLHSFDAEHPTANQSSPNKPNAERTVRPSLLNFNESIGRKLSSTMHEHDISINADDSMSGNKQEPITSEEITTISDDSIFEMESPVRMVQPKFKLSAPTYVSQQFYDQQQSKLDNVRADILRCENLLKSRKNELPDKGKLLMDRTNKLIDEQKSLALYISTLEVQKPKEVVQKSKEVIQVPTFDELLAAAENIQPKHTGKQGLANFQTVQTLTIDRLKDIHGSLETCPTEDQLAEPPNGLKIELMRHQLHALAWMNWRERQRPRGGILADDMGLGKTLTMISLVLDTNKKTAEDKESSSDESDNESDKKNRRFIAKGRKDYYTGRTLVVCPASLLRQWEGEIENRVKRKLISTCVHHGNKRETSPRCLAKYDMVITTYQIVAREHQKNSVLFKINWNRIILDEAHIIRNHTTKNSEAIFALMGKYRWALTGTPIQNKQMDLYALLKFLKCTPFDDLRHWKSWIDNKSAAGQQRLNTLMKSLMLRRTKKQLQTDGLLKGLPERTFKLIEVNLETEEKIVYQKILLFSQSLFAQFMHQQAERETSRNYMGLSSLPTHAQTKEPNAAYHRVHQKMVQLHHGNGTSGTVKTHQILILLLRLRQICCHAGLIDAMLEDDIDTSFNSSYAAEMESMDLLKQLEGLNIGEVAVGLDDCGNDKKNEAIAKASAKVLLKSNPVFDLNRESSKMKKAMELLERDILPTNEKVVIVSQWKTVLDILGRHLHSKGHSFCELNGQVPVPTRGDIVNRFNSPSNGVQIMLLSLTAGGIGLNLVGANHLILLDLHWNPQLEVQAQDRIYRVGQLKAVHIYKLMTKETVEERIKVLQDKKLEVSNAVLTGAATVSASKLSIEDLRSLFGM